MISQVEKQTSTGGLAQTGNEGGRPRDFLQNRFTYVVVSPRARGLSIGVNVNPDKRCNFRCAYCEVDRRYPGRFAAVDLDAMALELESTITLINSGTSQQQPRYGRLAPDLLQLRHVALSGDGEPTISSQFLEIVETVIHLRARSRVPFFKIVLLTNASGLDRAEVQAGLRLFGKEDEIWAKLDGGSSAYITKVNAPDISLEKILSNILLVAQKRPVVIQSLFPKLQGSEISAEEIAAYIGRLNELKAGGARIPLVQIYSATQPSTTSPCSHLSLGQLVNIAQTVRKVTGLNAQVF